MKGNKMSVEFSDFSFLFEDEKETPAPITIPDTQIATNPLDDLDDWLFGDLPKAPAEFEVKAEENTLTDILEEEFTPVETVTEAVSSEVTVAQSSKLLTEQEKLKSLTKSRDAFQEAEDQARADIEHLTRQISSLREKRDYSGEAVKDLNREIAKVAAEVEKLEHFAKETAREQEIADKSDAVKALFKNTIDRINPSWVEDAYPHQWEAATNLAMHKGGLLADGMGLGKTLTTIMIMDMLDTKYNLIVTPKDVSTNFQNDMLRWASHRYVWDLAGAAAGIRNIWMEIVQDRVAAGKDVTIILNYDQLSVDSDYFDTLLSIPWDAVFIDEFHNAKDLKGVLFNKLNALRQRVDMFFPITGTFILNQPTDIWTALHLVDPIQYPDIKSYRAQYCTYDSYTQKWTFKAGGAESLAISLGGRIVQRTMKDVGIELPKQNIIDVPIAFPENAYLDQQRIMSQLKDHSQIILDEERNVSIVETLAIITRQRQCAVWPAGIEILDPVSKEMVFRVGDEIQESIKMDWAVNKAVELIKQGKRVCVFSQFKTALAEMEAQLFMQNIRVVRYDGDTKNDIRVKVKKDFDRREVDKRNGEFEWEIVLCNFKTGGVGLNFTHVTEMIMLDEEWNPGKNEQAYKRIDRIGQTEETNVWIPQLENSIDSWMRSLNLNKRDMIAGFNDNVIDLKEAFKEFLES